MKFGRLTAIKKVGTKGNGKGSKSIWLCRCDCGNEKEILRNSLVSGTTKSCGCLEKEVKATMHLKHGMAKSRIWNIWTGMRDRCSRPNNKNYQRYGGEESVFARNGIEISKIFMIGRWRMVIVTI